MNLDQLLTITTGYKAGDVRRALVQALRNGRPGTSRTYRDFYIAVYAQLRLLAHRQDQARPHDEEFGRVED